MQDLAKNPAAVNDIVTMMQGYDANTSSHTDAARAAYGRLDKLLPGPSGHMYQVNIAADPAHFLDWDKPLSEQSPHVQQALQSAGVPLASDLFRVRAVEGGHVVDRLSPYPDAQQGNQRVFPTPEAAQAALLQTAKMQGADPNGSIVYQNLASPPYGSRGWGVNDPAAASIRLQQAGIPGIRYLDGGSRGNGEGTRNTVVFDPATIAILRKYGLAGLMVGGAAGAARSQ
jgi:hypothetical protein